MDRADFFEQVYQVVRLVPRGRVTSYGTIAAYLGTKGSSRMVGYAMNGAQSVHQLVPGHRVVNRQGLLPGQYHFESHSRMKELLEAEGGEAQNAQVQHCKKHFWDPALELDFEA